MRTTIAFWPQYILAFIIKEKRSNFIVVTQFGSYSLIGREDEQVGSSTPRVARRPIFLLWSRLL